MSSAVQSVNIFDTAYFEDRVIAIAHKVKKESGFVNVNDVLKSFGFTSKRMHKPIAKILDVNGFKRKKRNNQHKPDLFAQSLLLGWSQWTPFVTYATPDQNTPRNP